MSPTDKTNRCDALSPNDLNAVRQFQTGDTARRTQPARTDTHRAIKFPICAVALTIKHAVERADTDLPCRWMRHDLLDRELRRDTKVDTTIYRGVVPVVHRSNSDVVTKQADADPDPKAWHHKNADQSKGAVIQSDLALIVPSPVVSENTCGG